MSLLEKTRRMSQLLQQTNIVAEDHDLPFYKMSKILAEILTSNVYIITHEGIVVGYTVIYNVNNDRINYMLQHQQFPKNYLININQVYQTQSNIPIQDDRTVFPVELEEIEPHAMTTIVPVYGAGERLGTVILGRIDQTFHEEDLILSEYAATIVGIEMLNQKSRKKEAQLRELSNVQMAMSTLSFSELKAVKAIFDALNGDEGRLTASTIADRIGITRSVIVNALRKLESAGIIESRSLGMKGTYIRIINPFFKQELEHVSIHS